MISAQTIEAYGGNAVAHVKPLAVGLNCSLGPDLMSCHFWRNCRRNPIRLHFVLSQRRIAKSTFADRALIWSRQTWAISSVNLPPAGLLNIAGGCCGNTPELYIAAIAKALVEGILREFAGPQLALAKSATLFTSRAAEQSPGALDTLPLPRRERGQGAEHESDSSSEFRVLPLRLSGSQPFTQQPGTFIMIGERTNVAGSLQIPPSSSRKTNIEEAVAKSPASRSRTARTSSTFAWTRG